MARRDATRSGPAARRTGTSAWGIREVAPVGISVVEHPPHNQLVDVLLVTTAAGVRSLTRDAGRFAGSVQRIGEHRLRTALGRNMNL